MTMNLEQMRMVAIAAISPIVGLLTPTSGFVEGLVIMFAFNIWAGMRADGVAIQRIRNFSFRKFCSALGELFLYLFIIEMVYLIMYTCGDSEAAILIVKSITYVFLYVYLQNSFRNLVKTYPRMVALRVIYHVIRLEFSRALPSNIQPIIEKLEQDQGLEKDDNNDK